MVTLQARHLITADAALAHPVLQIDSDGIIAQLETDAEVSSDQASTLAPAFLDIHTHGAVGEDVMSATPEGFTRLQRFYATPLLARHCPTSLTAPRHTNLST